MKATPENEVGPWLKSTENVKAVQNQHYMSVSPKIEVGR